MNSIGATGLRPVGVAAGLALIMPSVALACACGCGVFDVGDATLISGGPGGSAWLEGDWLDQTRNWSGSSRAPAADDPDKRISTDFVTLGGQHMFKSGFGVMVQIPFMDRSRTVDGGGGAETFRHAGLGDVRLTGVYSGFSPDMSTGITFGLKLPTGGFHHPGFDRDVELGTGTTDLTLGGYHLGSIGNEARWSWFVQGIWDHPLGGREGYRPGGEADAAAGLAWAASQPTAKIAVSPMLQLIGSVRARDGGPAADPANSGYERLMIAPGVEFKAAAWKLYGDVEFPIYQRVNGNQLVAPTLFKVILSRSF
ncbi:MAG TPA: hypothetical protein VIB82_07980 [Caulobacteraceae bacterium]|jgi:hypothetical protein